MASSYEKFQRRRLLSSYVSVVMSIFLVLFLLGSLGFFLIHSEKISNSFKEQFPVSVYFNNATPDSLLKEFDAKLAKADYIKTYAYIPKEEAAKNNVDILGEDFLNFLGENPLPNSFDLFVKGDYLVLDSLTKIERDIKTFTGVDEVNYDKTLVNVANENIQKITLWTLIISVVFLVVSMLLINSTLRLSVYSKRFIIKTMQMVGATKAFIRKPFIYTGIKLGIIGAVLANSTLAICLYFVDSKFPTLEIIQDYFAMVVVFGGVLLIGILISLISTFFATQRFLNLRTDDLY